MIWIRTLTIQTSLSLIYHIDDIDQATQNLEADLIRVAKWCSENELLINPDKIKLFLIGNRQLMRNLSTDMTLNFLGKTINIQYSQLKNSLIIHEENSKEINI